MKYIHRLCPSLGKPPTVVPARFLVACPNGHLDDFPWPWFVHRGREDCSYLLRLYEFGTSGEAADVIVKCDTCGARGRWPRRSSESTNRTCPRAGAGAPT
jgi:hypothetical protein